MGPKGVSKRRALKHGSNAFRNGGPRFLTCWRDDFHMLLWYAISGLLSFFGLSAAHLSSFPHTLSISGTRNNNALQSVSGTPNRFRLPFRVKTKLRPDFECEIVKNKQTKTCKSDRRWQAALAFTFRSGDARRTPPKGPERVPKRWGAAFETSLAKLCLAGLVCTPPVLSG